MTTTPPILALPPETLHAILVSLDPVDVSSFSQTCRLAYQYISYREPTSPSSRGPSSAEDGGGNVQLWKELFLAQWDAPRGKAEWALRQLKDPLAIGHGGSARLAVDAQEAMKEGKDKGKMCAHDNSEVGIGAGHAEVREQAWGWKTQTQRRIRAREVVRKGSEAKMLQNYDPAIRALISTAYCQTPKPTNHGSKTSNSSRRLSGSSPSLNARFLNNLFPHTREGDAAFVRWIFPRSLVRSLAEWHEQRAARRAREPESATQGSDNTKRRAQDEEAKSEDRDDANSPAAKKKRKAGAGAVEASDTTEQQDKAEGSSTSMKRVKESLSSSPEMPSLRRSHRLRSQNYPDAFRDLCSPTEGGEHFSLEDLPLPDMELAAHLHCLHGVRHIPLRQNRSRWDTEETQSSRAAGSAPASNAADPAGTSTSGSGSVLGAGSTGRSRRSSDSGSDISNFSGASDSEDENGPGQVLPTHWWRAFSIRPLIRFGAASAAEDKALRGAARERVYDMSLVGYENAWAPLKPFRRLPGRQRAAEGGDGDGDGDGGNDDERAGASAVGAGLNGGSDDDDDDDEIGSGSDIEVLYDGIDGDFDIVMEPGGQGFLLEDLMQDDGSDSEQSGSSGSGVGDEVTAVPVSLTDGSGDESASDAEGGPNAGGPGGDNNDEEDEDEDSDTDDSDWLLPAALALGGRGARAGSSVRLARGPIAPGVQVDWISLEAIMIVMSCNIKQARSEGWGAGIDLDAPAGTRGAGVADPTVNREVTETGDGERTRRDKDRTRVPVGWERVRGEEAFWEKEERGTEDDQEKMQGNRTSGSSSALSSGLYAASIPPSLSPTTPTPGSHKPHDWAHVEGRWIGTYAFLDFADFVRFNRYMGGVGPGTWDSRRPAGIQRPSLARYQEAVGDFMQLRLELLSVEETALANASDPLDSGDEQYPTLRFKGLSTAGQGPAVPAHLSSVHGFARPIYAPGTEGEEGRPIHATWYSFTIAYGGADRWLLQGVQPGTPGSRAPCFGLWTDVNQEEGSPCGPWAYWRADA